jgi:hypothetical protein
MNEKDSHNSPWNIIQREDDSDFVAYSVSSREIWGQYVVELWAGVQMVVSVLIRVYVP